MTLQIDGVLYLRILDPFKVRSDPEPGPMIGQPASSDPTRLFLQASYGVEDPEYAVTQLAQTTMRSELGKLTLDKVFRVTSASVLSCWSWTAPRPSWFRTAPHL